MFLVGYRSPSLWPVDHNAGKYYVLALRRLSFALEGTKKWFKAFVDTYTLFGGPICQNKTYKSVKTSKNGQKSAINC